MDPDRVTGRRVPDLVRGAPTTPMCLPLPRRTDVVEALCLPWSPIMLEVLIRGLAWFSALAMLILPILVPSIVSLLGVVGVLVWVSTSVAFLILALRGVDRA